MSSLPNSFSMHFGGSNLPPHLDSGAKSAWNLFKEELIKFQQKYSLNPSLFPALHCHNILGVIDHSFLHVVFAKLSNFSIPAQYWMQVEVETSAANDWIGAAQLRLGFVEVESVSIPLQEVTAPIELQRLAMAHRADVYVSEILKKKMIPQAIPGYEGLQPFLEQFHKDHPQTNRNVFLMMRFEPSEQHEEIRSAIVAACAEYGLAVLRADDRLYPTDGDLWDNICVYMMGCRFGICVFDEINVKEFSPNVPLEYGFMRAMDRRVLLLKDQRMKDLPSDMTGKLYRSFDTYHITKSITKEITQWAEKDLGLAKQP
jgi:hypothetical protein